MKKSATAAMASGEPEPTSNSSRIPLYQQVVVALRDEILKGLHPVGTQLPTEGELVDRFGVSRHTIREALRALRNDGLVSSRQGAGTTVERPAAAVAYVQEIASINDLIQNTAITRFELRKSSQAALDPVLAEILSVPPGRKWLRIEALRYQQDNDSPLCHTVVYVHADYAGVGRLVGRRAGPIFELIEDLYGERIAEVEQFIHASETPHEVAMALGLDDNATTVEVRRVYRTTARKIVQVAINRYPSGRFSFAMKVRRSGA